MAAITQGSLSQTLTYPFDVLRRKMQVVGLGAGALGYQYNGALDAARVILKTEGIRGMYRGLWPNLREYSCSGRERNLAGTDARRGNS